MPTAKAVPGKLLLSPTDHTLILIDFQSQMAFATKSIDPVMLRNNAALVANGPSERSMLSASELPIFSLEACSRTGLRPAWPVCLA
jgi:hypothetical protein